MNPSTDHSLKLAPALQSLLAAVRKRIRAYVWAEGIAVLVIVLGLSFWGTLGFDWVFEPPSVFRIAVLVAVSALVVWVLFFWILRRIWVRLADRSMAIVLERRFRQLQDSLLTSVELADRPPGAIDYSPQMLADTHQEALLVAKDLPVKAVFNLRPLIRRVLFATLLLASVITFGAMARDAFGIWVRRSLLMSDELWPRRTHLSVVGFDENGRKKIARGADLELEVRADADAESEVPQIVEIRYTAADGVRGRENMSQEGTARAGYDPYQKYTHTFKGLLAAREFFVVGGDDRVGPLQIDVVDSPTISRMVLYCEFPPYMRREPRDIPVSGQMQIPLGTSITVIGEANKPLVSVRVDELVDQQTPVTHELNLDSGSKDRRRFELALPALKADKTLSFTLLDIDGIRTREPIRLVLSSAPDEPPRVTVSLKGIGSAITPIAQLPAAGQITDDYGVSKAWFELRVDDKSAQPSPIKLSSDQPNSLEVAEAFEVESLKLEPKQKLHVEVQAEDNFALDKANVGASQKYVLDVVTPEQLRSMLEARELMLRRRFETIIEDMTTNRDSLLRINFGPPVKKPVSSDATSAAPVEPGDEQAVQPSLNENGKVQSERALQNAQRTAHETLGVAESFDEICNELINNRVDTEELKSRLRDGITIPLRTLAEKRFPELQIRLKKMQDLVDDAQAGPEARLAAQQETDAILVEMKQILNKMLELESFNEALDLLRDIIAAQERVNEQTKQRQKTKLRNLLEE